MLLKKLQPETPLLVVENSQPQLPIENKQDDTQPIKNIEGLIYDVDLENTF